MNADVISNHSFIKVRDAAMEIGMSADFVIESLIYSKKVQAVKMGNRWVINLDSWKSYLASLRSAA